MCIRDRYIISLLKEHSNFDDSKKKLENLEIASQAPNIWEDRIKAEKLFKEKNLLEKQIISINSLETEIDDAEEFLKIGNDEGDQEIIKEAENSVFALLGVCQKNNLRLFFQVKPMLMTVI